MKTKIKLKEKDILNLSVLSETQKKVIIMHFLKEKSLKKIAKELGLHYQTIKYHKSKAIGKLKDCFYQ